MTEQIITLETAELAKEKGFDIETDSCYCETAEYEYEDPYKRETCISEYRPPRIANTNFIEKANDNYHTILCYAPTQSLLQKWLREKHDIHVWLRHRAGIYDVWIGKYCKHPDRLLKYEEALEAGLNEALKLIKQDEL